MIISERLRIVREKKSLSQAELAVLAGLPKLLIVRIENGHALGSVSDLERLADALGVPLIDLFIDPAELPAFCERREREWAAYLEHQRLKESRVCGGIFTWIRAILRQPVSLLVAKRRK